MFLKLFVSLPKTNKSVCNLLHYYLPYMLPMNYLTFLNFRVILSLSPIDKYRDLFFSPSINLGGKVQTPFS